MSQIDPFTNSILSTPQAQRQHADDKDRQVRRANELRKNAALTDDQLEHQVESSEELSPIHEQQQHERRFKRPQHHHPEQDSESEPDDENPHLDLTA